MNSEWIFAIIISVVLKVFTNRERYKGEGETHNFSLQE